MKSIKIFATVGAIALLGMTGLTSCNQKNGPEEPGNYNGEVVKTQFAISIPQAGHNTAAASGKRYMPAAKTQDAGSTDFLGMENIVLMPFVTDVAGSVHSKSSAAVAGTDIRLGNNIGLTAITNNSTSTDLDEMGENVNYKIYSNVAIPMGTNHFLFYARGTQPGTPSVAESFEYGRLNVSNLDDAHTQPSAIQFAPVQIYGGDGEEAVALVRYLTSIANAKDAGDHYWKDHSVAGIKQLHDDFTSLRAGSALTVLKTVEDLYNSLEIFNDTWKASHGDVDDAVVVAVMTAIAAQVDGTTGETAGHRVLTWKSGCTFKGYPLNIHLPDGAASIVWNETPDPDTFAIASTYAWDAISAGSLDVALVNDYVYPACIYYYANSGLKTATSPQQSHYSDVAWASILTSCYPEGGVNGDDNIYVNSNTRSVAIKDPIQYGVARLKTSVKAADATILDSKNTAIDVTKLTMTGVLVGGQGPVKYNFSPDAAPASPKIVYDTIMTSGTHTLNADGSTYTVANPTLVLETYDGTNVVMAVEFLNGAKDFYGKDGKLIPKDTHFYVVAQLLASAATETGTKVFKQDYTTFVKLSLNNLTKAYNVVPDLTTSTLELGFSVDLTWQAGHEYIIPIE